MGSGGHGWGRRERGEKTKQIKRGLKRKSDVGFIWLQGIFGLWRKETGVLRDDCVCTAKGLPLLSFNLYPGGKPTVYLVGARSCFGA